MNPYIKLLGSTDIMSESGKKTSTVSPDQEMDVSLKNQWSWFLKQNVELLKLLYHYHLQEYNEVGDQEEEIFDRISDFTLVLFEYVKTLKKRKGRGVECV